jgi:hypothetical protein
LLYDEMLIAVGYNFVLWHYCTVLVAIDVRNAGVPIVRQKRALFSKRGKDKKEWKEHGR